MSNSKLSDSLAQIERLAARTLRSNKLPDAERNDLEEILHVARRGRDNLGFDTGSHLTTEPESVSLFQGDSDPEK